MTIRNSPRLHENVSARVIVFRVLFAKCYTEKFPAIQKELFSRYTDGVRELQTMAEYRLFQNSFRLWEKDYPFSLYRYFVGIFTKMKGFY